MKPDNRIFASRFIYELKNVGDKLRKKLMLVVLNYDGSGALTIATKAPNVQMI